MLSQQTGADRCESLSPPRSSSKIGVAADRLARDHDRGPDTDPVKQVDNVLVVHANAAIRSKGADRGWLVGAVNGVLAPGERQRAGAHRITWRATRDDMGQPRIIRPDFG